MEMKKCINGHFYDASSNIICPYCNPVTIGAGNNDGNTMAINMPQMQNNIPGAYQPTSFAGQSQPMMRTPSMEGKTVALFQTEQGIDPVVGWLVCINGVNKGREYRLHADNNYVGRDSSMDICIKGDDHISRENQAIITYDSKNNNFMISNGTGRSIVRLNGNIVTSTMSLLSGDVVEFGSTELKFVPFCGESFKWMD